jgi:hypothetical protein
MLVHSFGYNSYSRPISYRSYYPRVAKPEVLHIPDPQTDEVLDLLKRENIEVTNLGGLARGIRFWDYEVGKRHYNFNSFNVSDEYYIHEWKDTNDLTKEHPTGTHLVFKEYDDFIKKLHQVIQEQKKRI